MKSSAWKFFQVLVTPVFSRCLFTISILPLIFAVSGCNTENPEAVNKTTSVKHTGYGSKFETFVSKLKSLPETGRNKAVIHFLDSFPQTPVFEGDTIISLYWLGKAQRVLINGDLQSGWSVPDTMEMVPCAGNGFFHRTYCIPSGARLDYRLTVDTTPMTDPRNPSVTPSGYGPHSEIAMPGFRPNPVRQFRPEVPHGTIGNMGFTSRDRSIPPRQVEVYVPAGYRNLSKLPVLFVLDGPEAISWMSYPIVLDNLIADGKIEPLLVIFIPPVDRPSEFMGANHMAFMNAICSELVPAVDRKFRTACNPVKRGITGISDGGFLALKTLFVRPDVFRCGAGQSPTITDDLLKAFRSFSGRKTKPSEMRIYFDVGRYDLPGGAFDNKSFLQAGEAFHREMVEQGMNPVFLVANDGHEWAGWRERMDKFLVCFFGSTGSLLQSQIEW